MGDYREACISASVCMIKVPKIRAKLEWITQTSKISPTKLNGNAGLGSMVLFENSI